MDPGLAAGRTRRPVAGGTLIVIAPGPGLTQADCDTARAFKVLAIGDAYRLIDADYHYHSDRAWWDAHLPIPGRATRYAPCESDDDREWAQGRGLIPYAAGPGSGLGLDRILYNHNSGGAGINLAFLLGARRIILLGFDMQNAGGRSHFFGDHPPGLRTTNAVVHIPYFDQLAADLKHQGVEVINCSRETALYQFKRATLEQVI